LIENINKGIRIYTLRKLFEGNYAYIDIYTHDNSAGSQWVKLLKQGDVILSKTEVADKHTHLNKGQVVFIADETAYPAVAGILDFWKNPIPPLIILLASDVRDYTYFDDFNFPLQSEVHRVNCQPGQQAEKVINILEQKILIENVWGALENDAAKKIRHYLRNQRDLNGKNNHMKGYWRLNKL
ncbi:siderophore-interacting protein, partial [Acinetobacter qingfengensis]